ncbi:hypothetical protein TWF481_002885 [Arthrobotrys musiformis]|uniref:Uncharacterized protein n=1 Tax=Arthrobotrys musiformis TaxID=47236 RepID=A0AAV9VRN4_9PEZI
MPNTTIPIDAGKSWDEEYDITMHKDERGNVPISMHTETERDAPSKPTKDANPDIPMHYQSRSIQKHKDPSTLSIKEELESFITNKVFTMWKR